MVSTFSYILVCMPTVVSEYLAILRKNFNEDDRESFAHVTGATDNDLARVLAVYPDTPEEFQQLLKQGDGTWGRDYGNHEVLVYMFASDLGAEETETGDYDYPYFMNSCEQILDERDDSSIVDMYGDDAIEDSDVDVDPRIDPTIPMSQRLQFANCMNNGGTSQLYIDFNPTSRGVSGQIICYVHDPDACIVLTPCFSDFLQKHIDSSCSFLPYNYELDESD